MNTMFSMKFSQENWVKRLGQEEPPADTASSFPWSEIIGQGLNFSSEYLRTKAAQAEAKAAASRAEALRTSQTGVMTPTDSIPTSYLVIGAVGIAVIGLFIAIAS